MLRFADEYDHDRIVDIWNDSFTDDREFAKWYFPREYSCEDTIVFVEEGQLVSVVQRLPFYIKGIGKSCYIFGACTSPSARGKGYMGKLLEWSDALDRKEGYQASFLIPQNEKLFSYYKKYGFDTAFSLEKQNYVLNEEKCRFFFTQAKTEDAHKMKKLYEEKLAGKQRVFRTEDYFITQMEMFSATGGKVIVLYDEDVLMGYAFCSGGDNPYVQELVCRNSADSTAFCNELMKYYKINEITAFSFEGENMPLGLVKFYGKNENTDIKVNLMFN